MNKTFTRLKYIFVAIFLLASGGVVAYHALWVWPKQRCEASGRLWAGRWMKCATVYSIETLTRRPGNVPPINGEARLKPQAPAPAPSPAK